METENITKTLREGSPDTQVTDINFGHQFDPANIPVSVSIVDNAVDFVGLGDEDVTVSGTVS